jgi:hypothetical protein
VTLVAGLDLDAVAARHNLSGGHIRNVAVAAAHLACARGGPVDQSCLHRALDREYSKLGLLPQYGTDTFDTDAAVLA